MRFRKIRWDGENVELKWESEPTKGTIVVSELKSPDKPTSDFIDAMDEFRPLVERLLGLDEEFLLEASIRTLSIDERAGDERLGLVISVVRPIQYGNAPLNISTPRIVENPAEGGPEIIEEIFAQLSVAEREAVRYYNGTREQMGMFDDEVDEPDEDAIVDEPAETADELQPA